MYETSTLDNGLRVVTSAMPHTRSASIVIYYKVGSRYEPVEISGISHFIEHMLFKGTARRPNPQDISEAIEGLGGSLNAMTDSEYTAYTALVPSRHFVTALDVLTDMLRESRFAPEEVEHERSVIIEEINGTLDSPPDVVNEAIDAVMWGDQPIGRPIAGSRETVGAMSRAQLLDFLHAHYVPRATVVSVAGQVEHDAVVAAVQGSLGADSNPREPESYPPAHSREPGPRVMLIPEDTEQSHLCIGLPALSYNDPDRYGQQLLNAILGGGMSSSRLFVEIREKRALAYTVESYIEPLADVGGLVLYAGVDNDRVEPCIKGMLHELARLREEAPPPEELRKVKEFRKGQLVLALESSSAVAGWGGRQQLLQDRIESVDEVMAGIEGVTAEDVQRLAARLFVDECLSLSLVGPFKDEDRLRRLLTLS
ncbi:MAG TPA: pitrilysin family protein [Chloroflexia bacterium]|nr:pitrilysin family protein [Chloroflexia bacterium]